MLSLPRSGSLNAAPRSGGQLRVALLCSRRAPGLPTLLEAAAHGDRAWELAVCLTSDAGCLEAARIREAGIPFLVHDIRAFYARRGRPLRDLELRETYDRGSRERLAPFRPDLVALSGYLHILTEPMLAAFPDRIVNLHDADLTLRRADGRPRYAGLRSTLEAIAAGETETRSTLHIVTEELDGGPPLLLSRAFPVHLLAEEARAWGAAEILRAYAFAQREWMMRSAWGPMLRRAFDLFARGSVGVLDGRAVVDGALGPLEVRPAAARARREAGGPPRRARG